MTYIPQEQYQKYRDAALKLHKRGKVKLSRTKLYRLAEKQKNPEVFRLFNWAISNTYVTHWCNQYAEAKEKAGVKFNEDKWEKDEDMFEASLFDWHKIDCVEEHPAILLIALIEQYE